MNPRCVLPSQKYFSGTALPNKYTECRERVKREIQNVTHFASITDLWSSRTSEPYIGLTVHFITNAWELKSICLQTVFFPGRPYRRVACPRAALELWGLKNERQLFLLFTTDNASNMVKTMELNSWTRLQCFGHSLHLVIGKFK